MSEYYDHFTNVCKEMKYYVGYKSNERNDVKIDFDKVEQLRTELSEDWQIVTHYCDYLDGILLVMERNGWCLRFNDDFLENTPINSGTFVEYILDIWENGTLPYPNYPVVPPHLVSLSPISFVDENESEDNISDEESEFTSEDWDELCRQLQFDA